MNGGLVGSMRMGHGDICYNAFVVASQPLVVILSTSWEHDMNVSRRRLMEV